MGTRYLDSDWRRDVPNDPREMPDDGRRHDSNDPRDIRPQRPAAPAGGESLWAERPGSQRIRGVLEEGYERVTRERAEHAAANDPIAALRRRLTTIEERVDAQDALIAELQAEQRPTARRRRL